MGAGASSPAISLSTAASWDSVENSSTSSADGPNQLLTSVQELHDAGMSQREIALELAISASKVNRLLKKDVIRADKDGRRFLYSPVVSRDEWMLTVSKGLLDRLFAGRVAPLAAHFSRHGKLTKRDIADLKRLIAEIDDDV